MTAGDDEDDHGVGEADTVPSDEPPIPVASAPTAPAEPERSPSQQHLHDAVRGALFTDGESGKPLEPGRVFAGRYRLQQLLGRGAMGEVYRADDLVLGEEVAVKFLPPSLVGRPGYYERFVREVRLARQVSHPAVCRVHDIGEAEGRPFLSMEYVDGEDLASLLRRIGRLGPEKALEVAHQLCAGLAALHDRGIIHRDLKPSNIMVDGEGQIRIADFGLASIADELGEHEIRDGTPAYQAPEQAAGKDVTVRSDIYAVGLILREVFTGRASRDATSRTGSTTSETAIDPQVQAALERCLQEDPAERFGSTLELSAALPGGDPLAAALAAGRLPSPEAVANARAVGALSVHWARGLVVFIALALFVLAILNTAGTALSRTPDLFPPEVLRHRALEVLQTLECDDDLDFAARRLEHDEGFVHHLGDTESRPDEALADHPGSAFSFRLREFPGDAIGVEAFRPNVDALDHPGEVEVVVDGRGRLRGLLRIPRSGPERPDPALRTPDEVWTLLLSFAEIDDATLTPRDPEALPPVLADAAVSFTGVWGGQVHEIDAAVLEGRPVWFRVTSGEPPPPPARHFEGLAGLAVLLVMLVLLAALVTMLATAVATLRRREGDFGGARRIALTVMATNLAAWMLAWQGGEFFGAFEWLMILAGDALFTWLSYLMLEPYARLHWPRTLVSWNRLLQGRWRDPMVGRDMVIGAAAGAAVGVAVPILLMASGTRLFAHHELAPILGTRFGLAYFIGSVPFALGVTFGCYIGLLGLHKVLRLRSAAVAAFVAFVPMFASFTTSSSGAVAGYGVAAAVGALVMLRFGLLAMVFAMLSGMLLVATPITLRLSAWYGTTGLMAAAIVLAIAVTGAVWATAPYRRLGAT